MRNSQNKGQINPKFKAHNSKEWFYDKPDSQMPKIYQMGEDSDEVEKSARLTENV